MAESAFKVGQNVAPIFNADADADEAIDDAGELQLLVADGGMGGGTGVADERFHAAEADGIAGDFEMPEEFEGRRFAAVEDEGEDAAGVVALGVANADLFGIGEEGGVVNFLHGRVGGETFGDALGIFGLAIHAQVDGGEAGIEDPTFVRGEDVAEEAAAGADGLHDLRVAGEGDAGEDIRETAEVFGGGVESDVGAELEGGLEGGAEEGVIDHDQRAGFAGGGGGDGAGDVGHLEGGVGGGFEQDDAAVGGVLDGAVERGGIATGDGDAEQAPGFEELLDERLGAAVDGHGVDDGVAGAGVGHDGGHDGGHAGVEDGGGAGVGFERKHVGFDDFGVGVIEAGVDEVGRFAGFGLDAATEDGEGAFGGFGGIEDVGAGAEDRGTGGADRESRVEAGGQDGGRRVDFALLVAHALIVAGLVADEMISMGLTTAQQVARQAMTEQISRLVHGIYVYASILVVLMWTTPFAVDHPRVYWGCAACMVGGMAVRVALRLFGERWRGAFLETMMLTAVGLTSAPSGLLYLCSLLYYGFEDWTFTVLMIWTVGGASGSMVSFAPTLRLLVLHVTLLLVPALGMGLWQGGTKGTTFAIGTMVLLVFLLTQGVWLNRAYMKQLEDRATEEARLRELELAKAAAEAANVAKSLFLANMSHEIRTPMHGVMGMAQVVLAGELPAESRENVEAIHGASETLLRVLNEILDFSKVEAGKVELERAPFALRRVLEKLRLTVRPLAAMKGLRLEWTVEDAVPERAIGDGVRLRQILMNLLGNAVKFTTAGAVGLRVEAVPGALRFTVTDSGIGIPADKQQLIFEAFAQADGTVSRRFGGTGLGLAISAKLVELMGGRLAVRSELGQGSEFAFALCLPESAEEPVAVPERAAARERTGLRLLLAEDNAVSQRVAVALLGKRGHHVTVVENGLAAIAAWEGGEFDALLMDNQMPEMGGLDAVQEIRAREARGNRRRTPAVMLTASAMLGDRERFLEGGVDGYLAKPFHADELYAALAKVTAPPGCATQ